MTIVDMNDTLSTVQTAGGQPKKDLPPSMVERMTLILDAFDGRAARLTLEEVACRTQLPRSTVHRILDQLVKLDWSITHRSATASGVARSASVVATAATARSAKPLHRFCTNCTCRPAWSFTCRCSTDARASISTRSADDSPRRSRPASAAECSLIRRLVARRCWRGSTLSASTLCSGLLFPAVPRTRSPTSLCSIRN